MNLPYEALIRIMTLLRWVLDNKTDENDFVRNAFYAFQPFYNLHETMSFCQDQVTVTIPFSLAADLNSIVIKYSDEWNFMTGGE